MARRYPSLVGKKFGRLFVVSEANKYAAPCGESYRRWVCDCDCDERVTVLQAHLISGHTVSCGCASIQSIGARSLLHGDSQTRLYNIFRGMIARCNNKERPDFKYYGGKGVSVCDEWKENYEAFRDWSMANGYSDDLTIDRIDSMGNYEPNNCRWATRTVQSRNQTRWAQRVTKG